MQVACVLGANQILMKTLGVGAKEKARKAKAGARVGEIPGMTVMMIGMVAMAMERAKEKAGKAKTVARAKMEAKDMVEVDMVVARARARARAMATMATPTLDHLDLQATPCMMSVAMIVAMSVRGRLAVGLLAILEACGSTTCLETRVKVPLNSATLVAALQKAKAAKVAKVKAKEKVAKARVKSLQTPSSWTSN